MEDIKVRMVRCKYTHSSHASHITNLILRFTHLSVIFCMMNEGSDVERGGIMKATM